MSIGIAITRYRLYEIDRIISRTASYVLLTGVLAAVYVVVVVALQHFLAPVTGRSELAVAGATLTVAVAFGPARARLQSAVDRRFNRARYDAQHTVDALRLRLRNEVTLDHVAAVLVDAVRTTVHPAAVSLWLNRATAARNTMSVRPARDDDTGL
ncbi:MAG TPA: hypothetical protein VK923_04805 [Euzebyales bacterium]|nr:hypothetical protein [Euzebyales bacterium]